MSTLKIDDKYVPDITEIHFPYGKAIFLEEEKEWHPRGHDDSKVFPLGKSNYPVFSLHWAAEVLRRRLKGDGPC
jgi:hypothetical protein